ncbi:MAG: hypothetical protein C0609_03360 [Deltaproteobacteria bacterium]|nr:MAG: hypothetical protein C0609_03360 [Deltaproteobacteria bacterium]
MSKQWEYGQIFIPNPEPFGGLPKEGLNLDKAQRAGAEGWELVSSIPYTNAEGEVRGAFFLFKREKTKSA